MSEQAQVQLALADKAVANLLEGMKPGQAKKLMTARMQIAKTGVVSEESDFSVGRLVGMAAEMILRLSNTDDALVVAPFEGAEVAARAADLLRRLIEGAYNYWVSASMEEKSPFAAEMIRGFASLPREAATMRDVSSLLRIQELCATVPSMIHGSGHPEELAAVAAWETEMTRRIEGS
ncbi:hypothetical protein [Streptomyces murinus]|uniref:hypothetical protein n=1 Tax=Streptomyces murinus TaxID=33900 RepID=UPI0038262E1C